MSQRRHKPLSKADFEKALLRTSGFGPYPDDWYRFEWEEGPDGYICTPLEKPIWEYCYIIPLAFNPHRILKVYSSVDRKTDMSRAVASDAIRVVLADNFGQPVRARFKRINRIGTWRENLRIRISDALEALGIDIECPTCGDVLYLKRNSEDDSRFLGCSNWKDTACDGKRPFLAE